MKQRFQLLAAALLAAAAFSTSATPVNPTSATAGSSEGSLDITLNLTPFIIINGFDDITLDATSNSDISGTDTLCVGGFGFQTFSVDFGSLNGNADLTAANSTDPFLLHDSGTSETIPYSVDFTKGAQSDSSSDGSMATAFTRDALDTIGFCEGGDTNAELTVSVAAADWAGVDGTTFTDTLTVQVTAN